MFSEHFRMRYLVKRSLLWDLGLDVLGNRTPNFFIERDAPATPSPAGQDMASEIKSITNLIDDFQVRISNIQ